MVAELGFPHVAERIVDVLVPPIMEEMVKVVKTVLQERISERIRKQIVSSSRLLVCPRPQAETDPCSVQRNRAMIFPIRKW